ncbi:Theobromine synthase 2 [Dichanthelium oligosanthes]|uniref:Theobromine synthase 2 n=1 Tax=Dichanthelium oligosanthes TaxID=888268 RepID=A0A1E5VAR6_9POAL|nr:Theobromine synthase 2 [Dichanthelium oligosanthes]
MIGGDGETSYARNSGFQSGVQSRLTPLIEEAIADLCRAAVPGHVRMADLGCSSGPSALALASAAVEAVCRRLGNPSPAAERCRPEISVYLNDLPDNDFNTVFKGVPSFLEKHTGAERGGDGPLVLVFGAPGSFYGRLFSAQMLHLVCSSFSLHWLSQVSH